MATQRSFFLFLLLFVLLYSLGKEVFFLYPKGVKKTYNQHVMTEDGVSIVFDVFEPKVKPGQPQIPIILGHGIMVNKGVMRLLALELANAGFLAVALDFRGHGKSHGDLTEVARSIDWQQMYKHEFNHAFCLTPLTKDLAAIKQYLRARGDVNLNNLGYVGYSMGGGAGFADSFLHGDVKAMVGIAPAPDFQRTTPHNPPNLLIIAAKYDEVLPLSWYLKTMEKKTNIAASEIEIGRTYGSFADGTAARLYVDNGTDHFLAPWDFDFVRETRDWMILALSPQVAARNSFSYFPQIIAVALQTAGALGAFFLFLGVVAKHWCRPVASEIFSAEIIAARPLSYFIKRFLLFTIILSFPGMLLGLPLLLTPQPFGFLQLLLALGPGIAILSFVRYCLQIPKITAWYCGIFRLTNSRNVTIGVGLGLLFYLAITNSVGNLFGMVPPLSKGIWLLGFCLLSLLVLVPFTLFFQGIMQRKLGCSGARYHLALSVIFQYLIWIGLLAVLAFFPGIFSQHAYFLVMSWIAMLLPLFLASCLAVMLYANTHDPILSTLPMAIFMGIILCTISPPL